MSLGGGYSDAVNSATNAAVQAVSGVYLVTKYPLEKHTNFVKLSCIAGCTYDPFCW